MFKEFLRKLGQFTEECFPWVILTVFVLYILDRTHDRDEDQPKNVYKYQSQQETCRDDN